MRSAITTFARARAVVRRADDLFERLPIVLAHRHPARGQTEQPYEQGPIERVIRYDELLGPPSGRLPIGHARREIAQRFEELLRCAGAALRQHEHVGVVVADEMLELAREADFKKTRHVCRALRPADVRETKACEGRERQPQFTVTVG